MTVMKMQVTYAADGLATGHNPDCVLSERFTESYSKGLATGHGYGNIDIRWRVYVCCWAAEQVLKVPGDFVECGVYTGITSRTVCHYINFEDKDKLYYLFDTFNGIPESQMSDFETRLSISKNERFYRQTSFERIQQEFSAFNNVRLVKGEVPETLSTQPIDDVAFLHIDMNIAYPEVKALEFFWPKMHVGGIVILDDYNSLAHVEQKNALDTVAANFGVSILALPTGQGLMFKCSH